MVNNKYDPLVSIIIPSYNAERTIARALESCISQTFNNIEIILVDDNSRDDTLRIAYSYQKNNKNILICENEINQGVSALRPIGWRLAKGEFLVFLDADDELTNDAINVLMLSQRKNNTDIVVGSYQTVYPSLIENNYCESEIYFEQHSIGKLLFSRSFPWTLWGKLYRKSLFNNLIIPPNLHWGEDLILNTQIFTSSNCKIVSLIEDLCYKYYKSPLSMTGIVNKSTVSNQFESFKWCEQFLKHGERSAFYFDFYPHFIGSYFFYFKQHGFDREIDYLVSIGFFYSSLRVICKIKLKLIGFVFLLRFFYVFR